MFTKGFVDDHNRFFTELGKVSGVGIIGAISAMRVEYAIGSAGLAAMGTAVAVPIVAIGTGLALAGYGAFRVGKEFGARRNAPDPQTSGN